MSSRATRRAPSSTTPARSAPMPAAHALRRADELANTFKMLANTNRLKILVFLGEEEHSVSDIEAALNIHQPTLSQQLGELRDAGLIAGRKAAKSVFYRLTDGLGTQALETIYLSNGHAPARTSPARSRHPSSQAAVFASILSTRGSQAVEWQPGFNSLLKDY